MSSVQQSIEQALKEAFAPDIMVIENESHKHNVPANSETHFKITLVSEAFADKRQVQRHQSVYGVLREQMAGPVHALALRTYAPDEWQEAQVPESPNCLGGGK